jgi:hypothetical protein
MGETPGQEIAKPRTITVTDSRGRKIEVRKVKTLDRMRLLELVGPELSANDRYVGLAALAYGVISIDGDAVPRPASKLALEALLDRLDDDGFNAVAQGIVENFYETDKTPDQIKDAIKNG